ncbi:ankyrin repeat domain-containing protein 11-like [Trichogramma pretiosum]|uniref:ankyrin repeat domain-containing protein 11-like n=1 Tax=Trichogramma pretiosum TaxID=7493 RepID=UPI0006C986F9|nr:ankyrin repeat domain-containing protein 11-like [Trichogramma pretiosum]
MADQWTGWGKILMTILEFLPCSTCKNNAFSKNQFLSCGHFSCEQCIDSQKVCNCTSVESKSSNFSQKNDVNERIVKACSVIIEKIKNKTDSAIKGICTNGSSSPSILESESCKRKNCPKNSNPNASDQHKRMKLETKIKKEFRIPKNIDKKDPRGQTLLMRECRKNRIDNVLKLLESGADPNIPCANGWTSLQECADYQYFKLVELLLEYKADINAQGYGKRTALHEAAHNDDYNMVELLLKNGADINILDEDDKKPFDCCTSSEVKKLLDPSYDIELEQNTDRNSNTIRISDTTICSIESVVSCKDRDATSSIPETSLPKQNAFPNTFIQGTSSPASTAAQSSDSNYMEQVNLKNGAVVDVFDEDDKELFDCSTSSEVKKFLDPSNEIECEQNTNSNSNSIEIDDAIICPIKSVRSGKGRDTTSSIPGTSSPKQNAFSNTLIQGTSSPASTAAQNIDYDMEQLNLKNDADVNVFDEDDKKPFDCPTSSEVEKWPYSSYKIKSDQHTNSNSNSEEINDAIICPIISLTGGKDIDTTSNFTVPGTSLPKQYAFPNTLIQGTSSEQVIYIDDSDDEINICD